MTDKVSSEMSIFWQKFYALPLVGILRGFGPREVGELVPVCQKNGLTNIEITVNSPDSSTSIKETCSAWGEVMNVGAGTVCNERDLDLALEAGARFIITPILNLKVIELCRAAKVPVFPGAFTPTEIYQAWDAGADIVKVFPTGALGPGYIKDLRGPFPQIKLMPTGGVTPDSIKAFKTAGAVAFGLGGSLFDSQRVKAGDMEWIAERLKQFVKAWES